MSSERLPATRDKLGELPVVAVGVSVLAWIGLWVASTAGGVSSVYRLSMSAGTTVGSALVFLAAWEVMVIAMMLPSSLGFLTLFRVVTSEGQFRFVSRTSVCVGYSLVWAAVGCLTLLVDKTLYRIGSADALLASHASLFAGSILVFAGGFQLTALKRRCLSICSSPGSFLMRYYRRGAGNALVLGLRFGVSCLGCCWALMTLMVVLGGGSLLLMVLITAIMFAERAMGWDERFVRIVGLAGIALGVFVAASPDAVPALAQNAGRWIEMDSSMQIANHAWMFWCHA